MFPALDIKRERDSLPRCGGCLSPDRPLRPLAAAVGLYRALLGGQHDQPPGSVDMCWECRAVLRRVRQFQLQIQRAQHTLTEAGHMLNAEFASLSRLTTDKVYHYNGPTNCENQFQVLDGLSEEMKLLDASTGDCYRCHSEDESVFVESLPLALSAVKLETSVDSEHECGTSLVQPVALNKVCLDGLSEEMKLLDASTGDCYRCHSEDESVFVESLPLALSAVKLETSVDSEHECGTSLVQPVALNKVCLDGLSEEMKLLDASTGDCYRCHSEDESVFVESLPLALSAVKLETSVDSEHECGTSLVQPVALNKVCLDGLSEEMKLLDASTGDCYRCHSEDESVIVESLPLALSAVKLETSVDSEHEYGNSLEQPVALNKKKRKCSRRRRERGVRQSRGSHERLKRTVKREKRIKRESTSEEKKKNRIFPASDERQTGPTSDYDDVISEHIPSHASKKPFQCEVCSKTFTLKQTLVYHIRIHTGEKPFQCELCPKAFPRKQHLRDHAKTHTGEKAYSCVVCHKLFSKRTNMARHMLLHTGEKSFQCEVCSKQYTRNEQLLNHMRKHHDDKCEKPFSIKGRERLFKCEVCLKAFAMKGTLKTHMKSHSGVKPFQCEICLKTFTLKGTLNIHMKSHTGEKTFLCDICLKAFTHQGTLIRHIMTHTGEKPFECEVCSKKHSQKAHLLRHLRTHIGQKLFQCSICQKAFTSKQTMIIHFRNHTGEKPFQCERCPNAFTQKRQLLAHRRIHMEEKLLT